MEVSTIFDRDALFFSCTRFCFVRLPLRQTHKNVNNLQITALSNVELKHCYSNFHNFSRKFERIIYPHRILLISDNRHHVGKYQQKHRQNACKWLHTDTRSSMYQCPVSQRLPREGYRSLREPTKCWIVGKGRQRCRNRTSRCSSLRRCYETSD